MLRPFPHFRRGGGIDPIMPRIAAAAAAIIAGALIAIAFAWHMLVVRDIRRGSEGVGIVLVPVRGTLVVDSLRVGGAAMRSGLHVGDLVDRVGDTPVAEVAAADRALAASGVDIRVRRGKKRLTLRIPPQERPPFG